MARRKLFYFALFHTQIKNLLACNESDGFKNACTSLWIWLTAGQFVIVSHVDTFSGKDDAPCPKET